MKKILKIFVVTVLATMILFNIAFADEHLPVLGPSSTVTSYPVHDLSSTFEE